MNTFYIYILNVPNKVRWHNWMIVGCLVTVPSAPYHFRGTIDT